jgi:centrosomal protein CEP164
MAQKQVRLGRAIHTHPRTRDPRQRGSLDILVRPNVAFSPRFQSKVFPTHVRVFPASKKTPADVFRASSPYPSRPRPSPKQESPAAKVSKQQLVASTAAVALAAANPAHAGDLFGPEYAGMVGNVTLFIGVGIGAISALFLPIICGTLNPVQIAINLGLAEGEVSNLRKFKRNGEPMEHGTKFGHKWYNTDAYCNGKYIDFAGTKKTVAAMEKK